MSSVDVDKVLYINLDFREDRKKNIERQVKNCRWPVERVAAVRLSGSAEEAGITLIPSLEDKIHVASIWLSHKKALKAALSKSNGGSIILLEDDVRIADDFWQNKLNLSNELPNDWEIIFFSPRYRVNKNGPLKDYSGPKWLKAPTGNSPVLLKSLRGKYVMTGAHFVVFRNDAVIKRVLAKMNDTSGVYDVDKFYLAEFKTFGIDNGNIGTGPFGSDHH